MFLSEFTINAELRSSRHLLASPQRLHAAVLACFPPKATQADGHRALWRVDQGKLAPKLFVVSHLKPDFRALTEQAGWQGHQHHRTADYEPFLKSLATGQRWQFRLRANPVVSVRSAPGPGVRGKRVPCKKSEQVPWLMSRAEILGVEFAQHDELPQTMVTDHTVLQFTKGAVTTVTLATAQFDGAFEIREPDKLRQALISGIGPAKGYGCGLMTLTPLR